VQAWEQYADALGPTAAAAIALQTAAKLAAQNDDPDAAARAYGALVERFGSGFEDWSSFPGSAGYSQNRRALDLIPEAAAHLGDLAFRLSGDARLRALRQAAHQYPLRPAARRAALEYARGVRTEGATEAAAGYALLALDQAGDHDCIPAELRLSHNRVHYDLIIKPSDPEVLGGALELLAEVYAVDLSPDLRESVVERWLAAEDAGRRRDYAGCRAGFAAVSQRVKGTALAPVAGIVMAQWLRHMGFFVEAKIALPEPHEAEAWPAVAQFAAFERGRVGMSNGLYEAAATEFASAEGGPNPLRGEHARLFRAECLEFSGQRDAAQRLYAGLASEGNVYSAVSRARMALKRLHDTSGYTMKVGSGATYWGEDRQTQGEWGGYGRDLAILCVGNGPADQVSGSLAPWPYRVYTTDPERHFWWWTYESVVDNPAVLHDPTAYDAPAANWDDGREKYPIGTGPDLLFDMTIPDGPHRLSLYFVNDFNYYEPNREYTVYLLSKGAVLAACAVRDFEGGLYQHFAVNGPREISVHIFRNLSMNVLLQGVFLDRLDASRRLAASEADYGRLHSLLEPVEQPEHIDARHLQPAGRMAQIRGIATGLGQVVRSADAPDLWRTLVHLNLLGAGRGYEERVLAALRDSVISAVGSREAVRAFEDAASAQAQSGQIGVVWPFTRCALEVGEQVGDPDLLRDLRLRSVNRLLEPWERRVQSSGRISEHPTNQPTDRGRVLPLMEAYVADVRKRDAPEAARVLLLERAHEFRHKERTLGRLLFEIVGVDTLTGKDLYEYSWTLDEDEEKIPCFERLLAEEGTGSLSPTIMRNSLAPLYAWAGNHRQAETYLSEVLAAEDIQVYSKANLISNVASIMLTNGDFDRAQAWYERLIADYPDTPFAVRAPDQLARIEEWRGGDAPFFVGANKKWDGK
jgi:tetratricopeptide (TPR) repeat protein